MFVFTILKEEIDGDPIGRGYASMTNAEVTISLNTVDRTRLETLSMQELREWTAENARGFNIMSGITNVALTDQVRNLCYVADKLIGTDDGQLSPGNALHVDMINDLVAASVISNADRTALVTKATKSLSRATELGIGQVKEGHVQEARK